MKIRLVSARGRKAGKFRRSSRGANAVRSTLLPTLTTLFHSAVAAAAVPNSGTPIFDLQSLQALIAQSPITRQPMQSVAELIPHLPNEMRENFTFVYSSRSPHGMATLGKKPAVDAMNPRTIVFHPQGTLALAFTSKRNHPSLHSLEVMAFDAERKRFVFTALTIPPPPQGQRPLDFHTKENPSDRACLRCHGSDPRPIFDEYPFWFGFYGSQHDSLPEDSIERKNFARFLGRRRNEPLFAGLRWPMGSAVEPYLPVDGITSPRDQFNFEDVQHTPNLRMGVALTQTNRQRIFRKMKESPYYEANRFRIAGQLLACRPLDIDPARLSALQKNLREENSRRLKKAKQVPGTAQAEIDTMMEIQQNNGQELYALDEAARLLQISRRDWSLSFELGSNGYYDGISNTAPNFIAQDIALEVLRDLEAENSDQLFQPFLVRDYFPRMGKISKIGHFYADNPICQTLADRQAILDLVKRSIFAPPRRSNDRTSGANASENLPKILARCNECHSPSVTSAPPIPWDRPSALRKWIDQHPDFIQDVAYRTQVPAEDFGAMPMNGRRLTSDERAMLIEYLRSL